MSTGKKLQIRNSTAEFLVFTAQAGQKGIEVRVEDETVWLPQKLIATLFAVDIRTASERRFYQKITDIYATAMDYRPEAETTQTFFATVQNKLHFAIHGHTAAERIVGRADIC